MVVQHNLTALNTSRMLNVTNGRKAKTSEKLSSGYKINRAADDAAGLSISEKMRKQVRGLERGVENTLDGISLCQVMDGALNEVTSMVQRISELSIQSANGTNSDSDREAIQNEVDEIVKEINRVGETTKFNEIYPFKMDAEKLSQLQDAQQNVQLEGNIPFSDFKLADISLGMNPFTEKSDPNYLALQAIVDNDASAFDGKTYNMIFGNGSTSSSSFKLEYTDDPVAMTTKSITVNMSELSDASYNYDAGTNTWTRTYNYKNDVDGIDIDITQMVKPVEVSDTEKNYEIAYTFKNNKPDTPLSLQFMFHADTAYNNNDICEGYFMNGKRIENNCIYSNEYSLLTNGKTSPYIYNDTDVPNSFSVVDVDNALAFSEKISFSGTSNSRPFSVSIGQYSQIDDWGYYDNLDANLGGNTNREDLGFTLFYAGGIGTPDNSKNGESVTFSFNYGIVAADEDDNLDGVVTNKSEVESPIDYSMVTDGNLWIQSGAEAFDGMFLTTRPMNADVLGLSRADLSTEKGATKVIDATTAALQKVSEYRSTIGAQQNRLEHTVANEENIVENTTAAESRIRDTDMAEEMVAFSMNNILAQAGQAMLAQANQSTQGVLSLLQ